VVACTPHPGYGSVSIRNGALVRHVDLATCRTWTTRVQLPTLHRQAVTLSVSRAGDRGTQQILYRGRPVLTVHERYDRIPGGSPGPIELFGTSPDGQWVLYAIDPQNSASLAADGLTLAAVSIHGGRPRTVAAGLLADDYRTWCGGKLVVTAGGDRFAAHHKWLIATGPPSWRRRILVRDPRRAFGSVACDDGRVIVQSASAAFTMSPRWSLWRVDLQGHMHVLDVPPAGWSDDSPRVGRNGAIVFVRSHHSHGTLYALGRGPLLDVGSDDGYFGHRPWAGVGWSLQRS
jgi:hypothetical protein